MKHGHGHRHRHRHRHGGQWLIIHIIVVRHIDPTRDRGINRELKMFWYLIEREIWIIRKRKNEN
jgi:hypothetical protein